MSLGTFTTTNVNCPVLTITINNSNLNLSGNNVWRVAATTITDYSFDVTVTVGGDVTRIFGPFVYKVVCPNGLTLTDTSGVTHIADIGDTAPNNQYILPA